MMRRALRFAAISAVAVLACGRARSRDAAPARAAPVAPGAVGAVGPAAAAGAPSDRPAAGAVARPVPTLRELTFHYDTTPLGPSDVVVAIPEGASAVHRLPVLVALHGRGESLKGPKLGARGWVDDYSLGVAVRRLAEPPLLRGDLLGFTTEAHLGELNARLAERPFQGLIVVCPYLPDAFRGGHADSDGRAFAGFVVDEVLARVYREAPALGTAATTAIDGVSLGGRASLLVGLLRPEAFGSVGALQPALDDDEVEHFTELAARAHRTSPALKLRLVTSDRDYFLEPTKNLAHSLGARGVPHQLDVVVGPHSYEWNRGPGVYEMLLFHDRALR